MDYISQVIEIKPNKKVKEIFHMCFGYTRYIYNKGLSLWNELYEKYKINKNINYLPNEFRINKYLRKNRNEWEYNYPTIIMETAIKNLVQSFNLYFKKISNYPKYKSKKYSVRSCRWYKKNNYAMQIKNNKYLKLQGIKQLIRMKEKLKYKGDIKEVTITQIADKYYASITIKLCKSIKFKKIKKNNYIGIDLGIRRFATTYDDNNKVKIYKNINYTYKIKRLYNKLDFYNKVLSRKKYYSNNYIKAIIKLRRIYKKIKNIKNDYLHKLTTNIANNYKNIIIEDLDVSDLIFKCKNKNLRRDISRSLFYRFRHFLTYKTKLRNTNLIIAGKNFPSTQKCSKCGNILKGKKKLGNKKVYICKKCNLKLDRDINAALNLRDYGMHLINR